MKRLEHFREIRKGELYLVRTHPAKIFQVDLEMVVRVEEMGEGATFWKCSPYASDATAAPAISYLFEGVFKNLEIYELEGKDLPLFVSFPWKSVNFVELIKLGRTQMVEL